MSETLAKLYCSDKVLLGTSRTALFKVCLPAPEIDRGTIRIKLYYASKVTKLYYFSIAFDGFIKILCPKINISAPEMGFNKVWVQFYRIAKMLDSRTNAGIAIKGFAIVSGMRVTKNAPAVFAVCVVVILLVFNIALKVVIDLLRVDALLLAQMR